MSALPPPSPPGPFRPRRREPLIPPALRLGISTTLFLAALALILFTGKPTGKKASPLADRAAPVAVTATASTGTPEGATLTASAGESRRVVNIHGLEHVSDYDDVAQNRPYAALATHVRRLTDDEARAIRRSDVPWQALIDRPADYRGELLVIMGLLVDFKPVRLVPGAGPEGVEDAWRGWLVDPSGDEAWVFDTLATPPPVELRRDVVEVEAAFLKVYRYEGPSYRCTHREDPCVVTECPDHGLSFGPDRACPKCGRLVPEKCQRHEAAYTLDRDVPFLIARRIRVVPDEELQKSTYLPSFGMLAAVLAAFAIFIGLARLRSGTEGIETIARHRAARRKP